MVREAAVKCFLNIESGSIFIQDALTRAHKVHKLDSNQKRQLTELVTGAIKMRGRLEFIRDCYLSKEISRWTNGCLLLGLYQLIFSEGTPDYAAVNEFVTLAARHENPGAASLVNAILRNHQREPMRVKYPEKENDPIGHLRFFYSLPEWLCRNWMEQFGIETATKLAEWANSRQFPSLRSYSLREDSHDTQLMDRGGFERHPHFHKYYRFVRGGDPRETDVYRKSLVYLQDPSAGLAAELLDAHSGELIFDIGAAPGGKTINIFESIEGRGELLALESNRGKLKGLKNNLYRLGINSVNIIGIDVNLFYPRRLADAVLLDTSCSGIGTLARNADLRWRIHKVDLIEISKRQRQMLESSARLVRPGGRLVYSTCTITREENWEVVNSFLIAHSEFSREKIIASQIGLKSESITGEGDMLVLPHHYGTDGAYACRMRRVT